MSLGDITRVGHMSRWEPDAVGRLRQAALELYVERGYEQTTVADISERAGLTARTFFRHFADKREVLFDGSISLQQRMVEALEGAPASASPMGAVSLALGEAAVILGQRREHSRQRQSVIAAHRELQERELIKMASLASALADGLQRRGVAAPEASLAAEAGIAVFRVAFARWASDADGPEDLRLVMRNSLSQLQTLTAGS
jgi:AcrR family transcriptional regulator